VQSFQNIYITGFMAVGKSTTSNQLAHDMGWNFVDLDAAVERMNKSTITDLTERFGLSTIRKLEAEVLRGIALGKNQVVALGAGTLMNPTSEEIVRESGILVYLRAETETLLQRMVNDHSKERPLLGALVDDHRKSSQDESTEAKLRERIEELLEQRIPTYEKADLEIETEGKDVKAVAQEIEKKLTEKSLKASA
jgi:shikimate kinase